MSKNEVKIGGNVSGSVVVSGTAGYISNSGSTDTEPTIDFTKLSDELAQLREAMLQQAKTREESIAVGEVAQAEKFALEKDYSGVYKHLKEAGHTVLKIAQDIGVEITTNIIKKAIGI